MKNTSPITTAYLHRLAEPVKTDLTAALLSACCEIAAEPGQAHIVFCHWEAGGFDALKAQCGTLPIVVVSRVPDMTGWLDALEAGASDYCAAPFESIQMRWILDAHLRRPLRSAAA